ncbi:MAG: malto-oligosyltrehalose synthase, partial [Candidatus Hydrogenedentota bacterium]
RFNSLAQTPLNHTAPGVPVIYQGTELWNISLVDPDKRRPVDFELRKRLLKELDNLTPEAILARTDEGLPKFWVIRQALRLRHRRPEVFGPKASYRALEAKGTKAKHAVAYLRGDVVLTVAPRLVLGLKGDWEDTLLNLPGGRWLNVLTGDDVKGGEIQITELAARFPVGLFEREE